MHFEFRAFVLLLDIQIFIGELQCIATLKRFIVKSINSNIAAFTKRLY